MNIKFCTVNAHICMEYTIGWFFNWSPIKSTSFSHGGERGGAVRILYFYSKHLFFGEVEGS